MSAVHGTLDVTRHREGGPMLIVPTVHRDPRGFFRELYRKTTLEELGIDRDWVQVNHSRSARGVLRGLHFQVGEGQAKLVQCARGAIFDVTVDIRRHSPTYGQWEAHELDDEHGALLYIPVGFAHGFCVTSEVADVIYSCSAYHEPALERRIAHDDPALGIEWPDVDRVLSESDATAPRLEEVADHIPFAYEDPTRPR